MARRSGTTARRTRRGFSTVHPHAAGIDVGSRFHMVAVAADRDPESVRTFSSFTGDWHRLADWLTAVGISTVAMESTGVYGIPVFEILEARGFEVLLVNARHVKQVPGRKTDVKDAQWLQQLHQFGLLRGSFRPHQNVVALRAYLRQRERLIEYAASHIQHMQKALTQMNVQLHHVVSDITGVTGMRIVRAIVAGDRDPAALARHRDRRCKASVETIHAALVGNCTSSPCSRHWSCTTRIKAVSLGAIGKSSRLWHTSARMSRRRRCPCPHPVARPDSPTRWRSTPGRRCMLCWVWTSHKSTASVRTSP